MPQDHPLVAKTLSGLEQVLAAELTALGAGDVRPMSRMVMFRGDLRLLYKANLCCRTAIRVLRRLRKFNCEGEQHLYDEIKAVDWSQYLDPDGTLAIDPVVTNSTFTHSLYVAQKAKDAIVDQFRERTGRRPSVDLEKPDLRLNLHMNQNITTLYLDSSGDSLHKRGYRTVQNIAPINEVLAAGILQLAGWNRASSFMDGMCGSGTFLIEAALLARRIPPGAFRKAFGFEKWKDYDRALYQEVFREVEAQEDRAPLPFPIVGSDLDPATVEIARQNARNAGVEGDIRFECADFAAQPPPPAPGLLVMNPPYGERIEVPRIEAMYRMIGDRLKSKYNGWRAVLFSANLDALRHVGLRPAREIPMWNGRMESRLVEYWIGQGGGRVPPRGVPPPPTPSGPAPARHRRPPGPQPKRRFKPARRTPPAP
jgi:putative N6-adenine-specific DNA methylase